MRRLGRAHSRRGQAAVEFGLLLPVIITLLLGTVEVARAFYINISISGAARAGMRAGVVSDTTDIGDAIRSEPNSAIANTIAIWGDTAAGQANGCTPGVSTFCGDSLGCPASVFTGTRSACFAIRTCTLSSGLDTGTCSSYGSWQTRPESSNGAHGLQVLVVYKILPVTPFLAQLTQSFGGNLYVKSVTLGDELYF